MATIQGVYLALFGRPADPLGLSFFNAATNNGQNLAGIGPLQSSAEYQTRFAGQTNTQIITAIYQSLFNRDPDLAGLTFFSNALTNGTLSINNIAIAIYDGAQGADKTIRDLKEAAANAFTAAVDTVAEINGYSGDAAATSARAFITGITTTAPTADQVNAAVAAAVSVGGPAPTTLTLTTGPDALTGKGGSDIFVASETTLSSADVLDGAGGIDTLRYASSGGADVLESGFAMKDIERISVTSDLAPGFFTKFDLTGATGVTTVINDNSSNTASFTGLQNIVAAEMTNVSGGNTFIVYKDSVLAGTADAMSVTLKGNATNAGGFIGDLNIGNSTSGGFAGLETLNVTSTGSASKLNDITTGAKTINVTGDANLTVAANLEGATLIDASGFKGALSVVADSGALDVVVKGGTGNDTANFSNGFAAGDAFNGGDGTDTLGLTNAIATGALGGTTTSVEQLNVTTAGGGTLDASKFAGVTRITYDDGLGGATTITKGTTGQTIEVDVNPGANQNLTYKLATNGTADVTTIELDDIKAPGSAVGTISARDAETLNISFDDDSTDGKATLTVANVTFSDAKSLVLSGDAETTIAGFTFDPLVPGTKSALTTVDASGMTDHLKVTGLGGVLAEAGATIKLGTGNDSITNGTGLGADSLTLGAGKDTVVYTNINQSGGAKVDTIQDFKQGDDILDVSALGLATAKDFVGNFANFGAAQGAINLGGAVEAVFQADTNTLWVDVNNDGTLNADDLQVVLKGVTALTAADLGFVAGNNITLTAPGANVDLTTKTNSTDVTTKGDDTINSTVANLAVVGVNAAAGTDTLNVTDGGVVGTLGGFASIETLVLNAATTVDVTSAAGNSITKVVGSAKVDVVTVDKAQTNVALGDGNDTLNFAAGFDLAAGSTLDGGIAADTLSLNGSDISAGTVKDFEILNIVANSTNTLTAAQYNAFLSITGAAGAEQITFTTAGTFTGAVAVEQYNLAAGTNDFTLAIGSQSVVGAAGGTDTVRIGGLTITGTVTAGAGGGGDTLVATNGADISGAAALSGWNTLDLTGAITMTAAQHGGFGTIVAAGGADQITLTNAFTGTGAAAVETYVLQAAGNDTFTVGALAQNVNIAAGGTDTIRFGSGTFTGTVTGAAAGDIIRLDSGANIAGVGGIAGAADTLNLVNGNSTVTMTAAQFNGFTTLQNVGGTETIQIANQAAALVLDSTKANLATIEFLSAGNDTTTVTTGAAGAFGGTVNLSGGGSDVVTITNAAIALADAVSLTITNFNAAGADQIKSLGGASTFQEVSAAGTALTLAANGVLEITSAVGTLLAPSNVDGAGAETLIANALGAANGGGLANGNDITVVMYGGGNAYIYQVDLTTVDGNVETGDIVVELVSTLVGVAADSLSGIHFA